MARRLQGVGYNGELHERETGWQILGNGYRVYNPVLKRFHSADAESPFGDGGSNSYAYCAGDPLNYKDPSGRVLQYAASMTFVGAIGALGGSIWLGQEGREEAAETFAWVAAGLMAATVLAAGIHALNRHVSVGRPTAAERALPQNRVDVAVGDMNYHVGDSFDTMQAHAGPYVTEYNGSLSGFKLAARLPGGAGTASVTKPLRLESCHSGTGGFASTAQVVADSGRRRVFAPKGYIGNSGAMDGPVSWVGFSEFKPQRGVAKAATAVAHRVMHGYTRLFDQVANQDKLRHIRRGAR